MNSRLQIYTPYKSVKTLIHQKQKKITKIPLQTYDYQSPPGSVNAAANAYGVACAANHGKDIWCLNAKNPKAAPGTKL